MNEKNKLIMLNSLLVLPLLFLLLAFYYFLKQVNHPFIPITILTIHFPYTLHKS